MTQSNPRRTSNVWSLDKVKRLDMAQSTAGILREAIVSGRIAAGARITEMQLSAEMGISRSTLRTALLELEKEDLIVRTPYSAWAVPEPTPEMIWEIYTLRLALETLAVGIVAENLNEAREARLRAAFAALEAAEQDPALDDLQRMRVDLKFHQVIVAQTGHSRLIRQYDMLLNKIAWIYAWVDSTQAIRIDLPEWHRPIFDAIVARRPEEAMNAVKAVLTTAYQGLSRSITEDEEEAAAS